ncbi:MAG: hypothetical protein ONB44_18025 [candidate division KSB1 bacterium]|nr:hypothetical protein [candidate division KSB1 bacterium]MDZ7304026.1 hypothetical protein [candidate division KSB1 bacterium]
MYVDWITWGIWLLGLVILVVWIWIPLQEFKKLMAQRRKKVQGKLQAKG